MKKGDKVMHDEYECIIAYVYHNDSTGWDYILEVPEGHAGWVSQSYAVQLKDYNSVLSDRFWNVNEDTVTLQSSVNNSYSIF